MNTVMKNWVQFNSGQFIDRLSDSQKRYLTSEFFTGVLKDIKFSCGVTICKLVNSYRRFGVCDAFLFRLTLKSHFAKPLSKVG